MPGYSENPLMFVDWKSDLKHQLTFLFVFMRERNGRVKPENYFDALFS